MIILGCMIALLGMESEGYAELGDTGADLIYTPVPPCRIIDTRQPGAGGPIPGNGIRDFVVVGTTGFESQGGNVGGCGIPEDATSAMVNFIAVGPTASGHLRAWPYGGTKPNASIVNFTPGVNIANGLIQPICNPANATCTFDLSMFAASDVSVVADVLGYFRRFPREQVHNPLKVALLRWYEANQMNNTFAVGDSPYAIAFDGTNIWVANLVSDNVTKLNAATGAVVGTYPAGDSPRTIAFDGANIWVTNFMIDKVSKL